MSFFFLRPVGGIIGLHELETITFKRLDYLLRIAKGEPTTYNEFVIEGSTYDNIGHFMLCNVAILRNNPYFTQFYLKAEEELFDRRFKRLSADEMQRFVKKVNNGLKKLDISSDFLKALKIFCQHLHIKHLTNHICLSTHECDCTSYYIELPFSGCLIYITNREVEVKNGIAYLPCGKWKHYLLSLFKVLLQDRLYNTNLQELKADERIMDFVNSINLKMFTDKKYEVNALLYKDIDAVSKYFPPCMLNLHKKLLLKNRLSHTQRFYYTTFLKDIGMPLDQAIEFWKMKYQQIPNENPSCSHNWRGNENKYIYEIKHMYGLEGRKINYTGPGCHKVQSAERTCSEGGCPFKSFDDSKFLEILNSYGSQDLQMAQINELRQKKQYTSACTLFMKRNYSLSEDNDFSFKLSPFIYYMTAAKVNIFT